MHRTASTKPTPQVIGNLLKVLQPFPQAISPHAEVDGPHRRSGRRRAAHLDHLSLFKDGKEAVARLFAQAQALTNDYERFEWLVDRL
jgi:hypothetical protein